MKDMLLKLAEATGPSGSEDAVRELVKKELAGLAEDVRVDAMGNLLARTGPRGRASKGGHKVLLMAHLDEVGLVVTNVEKNGFLRFSPMGRLDPHVCLGQRIRFTGGALGVIDAEPVEKPGDLKMDKLFIDIGAASEEEARKTVRPGDMAAFDRAPAVLGHRVTGRAVGSRGAAAVLLQTLRGLRATPHEVLVAFTVQKEVGSRGARPAAFGVDPDLALVLDATATGDTPEARRMEVSLGKGPAIKVQDQSGMAYPALRRALAAAAEKAGKSVQYEVLETAGSELGVVQLSHGGIPASGLSIPTRYRFGPTEVVDVEDLEGAVAVLTQFLKDPVDLSF